MRSLLTLSLGTAGAIVLTALSAHAAAAQSVTYSPSRDAGHATVIEVEDRRSGPRVGAAYLVGGSVTAEREGVHVAPLMSLFGWQVEHPFPTGVAGAPLPIVEMVALVGGIEQNRALFSYSMILGARQPNGWEAGIGPTLTGAGAQLTFAGGITRRAGLLNVPLNLAVSPGRRGASISFTTGFNRHAR